jgi:hypothetical protein
MELRRINQRGEKTCTGFRWPAPPPLTGRHGRSFRVANDRPCALAGPPRFCVAEGGPLLPRHGESAGLICCDSSVTIGPARIRWRRAKTTARRTSTGTCHRITGSDSGAAAVGKKKGLSNLTNTPHGRTSEPIWMASCAASLSLSFLVLNHGRFGVRRRTRTWSQSFCHYRNSALYRVLDILSSARRFIEWRIYQSYTLENDSIYWE